MKFHGTCLDKQTDLNRFLTRELAATTARSKDPFVKFVRLFIQVKNSAIRHVNRNRNLRPACSCTREKCTKCTSFLLRVSESRKGPGRYFIMLINIKYVERCKMYHGTRVVGYGRAVLHYSSSTPKPVVAGQQYYRRLQALASNTSSNAQSTQMTPIWGGTFLITIKVKYWSLQSQKTL